TGVAFESTIMPLKVLSGDGRGSIGAIANAIRYAADNGAQVINMSLGGPLPSRVLAKAVAYAHDNGVTVVCAAGNERKGRIGYPAAHKGAVAVAATDFVGERTWYSNWGKHLDISAPGGDTRADKNGDGHPDGVLQNTIALQDPKNNEYMWLQGTSMASPHAAGVAALVVSAGVTHPDEVERILKQTAVHPNNVEWDQDYGAGIIDANEAVKAARSDYTPERAGILGLLGLGLSGLLAGGAASTLGRRRRTKIGVGVAAGAAAGMGLGFTPLAYGLASATGLGFGSPLLMSAALPALAILALLSIKQLRAPLAGLSFGYAALLLHGAIVLPTLITGLPGGPVVDQLWLFANAIFALWLGVQAYRSATRVNCA
ncbi:MAG: S8 family serine peptidase, partial [Nannocystaceae bacterium]